MTGFIKDEIRELCSGRELPGKVPTGNAEFGGSRHRNAFTESSLTFQFALNVVVSMGYWAGIPNWRIGVLHSTGVPLKYGAGCGLFCENDALVVMDKEFIRRRTLVA